MITTNRNFAAQLEVCTKYGAQFLEAPANLKAGVAANVRDSLAPINGLRHPPEGDTTGWYIWAGGEPKTTVDFFKPLHIKHLEECCPQLIRFLGLSPGWRFLIHGDHEDVWFDPSLLNLKE